MGIEQGRLGRNVLQFSPIVIDQIIDYPEGYKIRSRTGSQIKDTIAKWMWRALLRMRALEPFGVPMKRIRYGEAEQEKVSDLIHDQLIHLLDRDQDPEDYALLVGAKEFAEIIGDPMDFCQHITVPARTYFRMRDGYKAEFDGIPIHVVQSMSGAVVVPKVLIEKRS